jgi:hypothetical protein
MTFLNPLYLLAALAGAIPLLIHLMHKKRVKVIEFSSLEFLKRIEGRKTRWFRIREVLLLVMRSLAIFLLAVAVSRPVLRSFPFVPLGAHARTSSVFVIDDSYSMGARSEGGTSFDRARTQAVDVLRLLDKGDEVFLLFSSDIPEPVFQGAVHSHSLVRAAVWDAELTRRGTDFKPSLEMATALLEPSRNLNREIYLFTDMQRSGFESFSKGGLRGSRNQRLYIFDSAPSGEIENVAVEDLALADPLLFEGGRLELVATLRNYASRETRVSLRSALDGREMGVKEVSLPAGSARAVELAFSLEGAGLHHLTVAASDDDLVYDNERSISFKVPGRAKVALVLDKPGSGKEYLETALSPEEGLSVFSPRVVGRGALPSLDLAEYDCIALQDISTLNSADVLRLANYVEKGGGLFVALGPSVDIDFYNSVFFPRLAPMELEEGDRRNRGRTYFLRIAAQNSSHPIFSQFREKKYGDLSIIQVYDRLKLRPRSGTIARLSDSAPLFVESRLGKGKVIVSAIPFDGSFSDLPLRALYVPLVHRIFRYLSMGEEARCNLSVGERFSFPVKGGEQISCVPPDGRPVRIEPTIRSGRSYAEFDRTEIPGTYTLTAGDSVLTYFSVNPVTKESDLAKGAEEETRALLAELRPKFLSRSDSPDSAIFSVRLGVELTNPLIAVVLLVLAGEMVIAGRWRPPKEIEL